MKKLALAAAIAALSIPMLAQAESVTINPATAGVSAASANLDFKVVIPPVLFLRVSAGGAVGTSGGAIDKLTFTVPGTNIGDSTSIAAGASDGDIGNGAVTVRVFSNVGTSVSLNSNVAGQLINGSGDTIPWTQIGVVAAALPVASRTAGFVVGAVPHPTFSATTGLGTAQVLAQASKLVRQEGQWTFSYLNANVMPAGTYGDTVANHGRVTYTASQL